MKKIRRLCLAALLTLTFALSVSAGQIECGVTVTPPPEERTAATTERVITETVVTLLQSIMIGL